MMPDDIASSGRVRIGAFTFDHERGGLIGADDVLRRLRPKAYKLLTYLVQHPYRILERADLAKVIWPGVNVTDDSLTHLVREIRKAMDDGDGTTLRTVSGRGYMLVAQVQAAAPEPAAPAVERLSPGQQTTSFIGRQRELAELTALAGAHRLVTITGMGGIGKTRLLQKLAADLAGPGERMYWIDLALVASPADVPLAVSAGIGFGLSSVPIDQAVIALLRHRRGTLLIDNAEHVLVQITPLVQAILAECRDISVLVTSRVSLGIPGEAIYRLDPLPVPPADGGRTAAEAMQFDAVRLFVERVQLLVPAFRLNDARPEIVAEICRKLDGIALAIEMAVPRLQVLTAEQFLHRLDHRFDLLTSRGSAGAARQRSLRQMLEWSWELLSEPDQTLLKLLSVFVGNVSLSAITAMRPVEAYPDWVVLEGLTELSRSSLLIAEPVSTEPRYRLLETTRAFALQQMTEAEAKALRRQHVLVVIGIFEAAEREWPTADGPRWIQRYGPDADNLRSALSWAFGAGAEVELGLRLIAASYPLWWELPSLPLGEGRRWFDLAVAHIGPGTPAGVQARLWLGHSWRDVASAGRRSGDAARRAVTLMRNQDDPVLLGAALWREGCSVPHHDADESAPALLDDAIRHLRTGPPTKWLDLALVERGNVMADSGDLTGALPLYNEAFALAQRTSHWLALQYAASGLSELMFRTGARAEALTLLRRVRRDVPGLVGLPLIAVLAAQLAAENRTAEALDAIGDVLAGSLETGLAAATGRAIETLAMIVAETGEFKPAARMLGYALMAHEARRPRTGGRSVVFNRLDAALQGGLRAEQIGELLPQGAAWSEAEAIEVAALHYGWLTASVPGRRATAAGE